MESEESYICSYCGVQKPYSKFKSGYAAKTDKGKSICTRCVRRRIGLRWELLEKKDEAKDRGNIFCIKCGEERSQSEFRFSTDKDGVKRKSSYCIYCVRGISKEEYISRKEKKLLKRKKNNESRALVLKKREDLFQNNKEILDSGIELRCGKCGEFKSAAYFSPCPSSRRGFYSYCRSCAAKEASRRRKENITVRVADVLRSRLNVAVRKYLYVNHISAVRNLGCSLVEFVSYIESLMEDGMSWDNFGNKTGQWCFDHIVPLVHGGFVDISKPEQAIKASHYTNIRPMWTRENSSRNGTGRVEEELRSLGLLADDGTVTFPCDKVAAAM